MWHLLLNNLKGRKTYNAIIIAAVGLALTVALTASLMTRSVQRELAHKQQLLGPELAIVPIGTKETGHIYLTKGPPAHGSVPSAAIGEVAKIPEVNGVSPQKLLGTTQVNGADAQPVSAMLIAFDPDTDFMVLPWLDAESAKLFAGGEGRVVLGAKLVPSVKPGEKLELDGQSHVVAGRLRDTGSFMDSTAFFPVGGRGMTGDPSWVLLGIKPGSSVDLMINKLETNVPDAEVIARPEMLKTINDQLHGVLSGGSIGAAAFLVVLGALLVTGAMFALMVHERKREFGLLKAMGAKNSYVFRLIIGEAAALCAVGWILGLVLSALWLAVTGTPVLPGDGSGPAFILSRVAITLTITLAVGIFTAMAPALLAARMEPYAAIRSGE